jgi:hypothetical protein
VTKTSVTSNLLPSHPARYTKTIVERGAYFLKKYKATDVIDIFAGTGERIATLTDYGWNGEIYAVEIQRKWAIQAPVCVDMHTGDAESLPYRDNAFAAGFTSVTYGNRMADKHRARDKSKRNTYTHVYGEPLELENTGTMHFTGKRKSSMNYCIKTKRCYIELRRILDEDAIFILNVSDHIRKGKRIRTTLWHRLTLQSLGFEVIEEERVYTPRLRQGANHDKRVAYESIIVFRLNKSTKAV